MKREEKSEAEGFGGGKRAKSIVHGAMDLGSAPAAPHCQSKLHTKVNAAFVEAFPCRLGLIGGSSFLKGDALNSFEPCIVRTQHGNVLVYRGHGYTEGVVFVQRHIADPDHAYVPPHLLNKKAIASVFKVLVSHPLPVVSRVCSSQTRWL